MSYEQQQKSDLHPPAIFQLLNCLLSITTVSHNNKLPPELPIHLRTLHMAVPAAEDASRIAEAQKLAKSDPGKAEAVYKDILSKDPGANDGAIRNFETALMGLGELYRDHKRANDLAELVRTTRSMLSNFAKAKQAKLGMHRSYRLSKLQY